MPRGYTSRKLQVFAIHGHDEEAIDQPFNYSEVFTAISQVPRANRMVQVEGKAIAIPRMTVTDNIVTLTAYEGEEGNPLFFNFNEATERIEQLERGEMLANKTHLMADLVSREAIIEYNQKGAKAADIASTLEYIGRRHAGFPDLTLEFTAVVDAQFLQAIDRFRRIRLATVKMARPNQDWTEHADHFMAMAGDSRAHFVEISMSAERQESLARNTGIIGFIRQLVGERLPFVKTATLTGVREGEEAETSVSLVHHVEHQKVQVRMTEDKHVDDEDIERKMERFLHSRAGRE